MHFLQYHVAFEISYFMIMNLQKKKFEDFELH